MQTHRFCDIFSSIPYSQSLRIRRIYSDKDDANYHLNELATHLLKREYSQEVIICNIKEGIEKANAVERKDLLQYKQKEKTSRIPLVLDYHSKLAQVLQSIRGHVDTLSKSQRLQKVFQEPPLTAFRRPRNIPLPSSETGFTRCSAKKSVA